MPDGRMLVHLRDLPTPGAVTGVTWSADGGSLAAASHLGQYVTVWNNEFSAVSRIERVGGGPYPDNGIVLLNGGAQLLFPTGDDGGDRYALDLWDVRSASVIKRLPGPAPQGDYAKNRAFYFDLASNQSRVIGAPVVGGTLVSWRTDDWNVERVDAIPNGIASVKLFPDGLRAAAGSLLETWSLVELSAGGRVTTFAAYDRKFANSIVATLAVNPSGDLIVTGRGLIDLEGAYAGNVDVAARVNGEPAIKIWRATDGYLIATVTGSVAPVRATVWDPLGRYLAVLDAAAKLTLVDPFHPNDMTVVSLPDETSALAIHPAGILLAVGTSAGVLLFRVTERTSR